MLLAIQMKLRVLALYKTSHLRVLASIQLDIANQQIGVDVVKEKIGLVGFLKVLKPKLPTILGHLGMRFLYFLQSSNVKSRLKRVSDVVNFSRVQSFNIVFE